MKKPYLTNHGYTLLEITIAVVILGVIMMLALPKYQLTVENTKVGEALEILEAVKSSQILYYHRNNIYTTSENDLEIPIPTASLKHFENLELNTSDPIGKLHRIAGEGYDYDIGILANGDLCCDGTTPVNICNNLGIPDSC